MNTGYDIIHYRLLYNESKCYVVLNIFDTIIIIINIGKVYSSFGGDALSFKPIGITYTCTSIMYSMHLHSTVNLYNPE